VNKLYVQNISLNIIRFRCSFRHYIIPPSTSRDSTVSIATGYQLDGRGLIPSKGKRFPLYSAASRLAVGLTQSLIQWVPGALCQGVKWSGRKADHLPPSSDEAKNNGAITPLLHTSPCRSA
jgi:hypothetical protein